MNKQRVAILSTVLFLVFCADMALANDKKAPMFDYQQVVLDNGLRVITLEDFSCPIVAVQIWYHVGSKNEQPDRQGFAHMFEHMMFRGTDRLGPTDHFDFIRRVGGSCNGYTNFDQTVYVEQIPANQLELALWMEAERMSFLKIDQESFDTERKVVEEERRRMLNQPYGTVVDKVLPELFPGHPYRWFILGNIAHLRASSVAELRDFWKRHYTPNNATLVIVGAVKHDKAQELAKSYFGWIPRYNDPPAMPIPAPQPIQARTVNIKEQNAPAPAVGVLFRTVPLAHDDRIPLELLTTILGGGNSSRLYRELVAEKQLAVAAMATDFELEDDGVLIAGAVLPPMGAQVDKALQAIKSQIERLREETVSEKELIKARNQMLKSLVTSNLHITSKASLLGTAAVIEGDVSRVNQILERMRRVTEKDLQRVARKYLTPERSLTITIERNLMGSLLGKFFPQKSSEENAPITAEPEKVAVPPGRNGLERPKDYPEKAPMAEVLPPKVTPKFSTQKLPNGLKVIVVENHEVPFVSVRLGLRAGAWTESKPGVASMTMSMLTKGTAKHTEGELAEELETYAIGLSGSGGMNNCSVTANCLSQHVERMMKLLGEVALEPTFPEKEFKKLHRQTRTGLVIAAETPSYLASRELKRRLYGEHPYARNTTGEIEDLDRLKVADLQRWWSKFVRPDMAALIFAGDIDQVQAMELAEKTFGQWRVPGKRPEVKLPKPPKPSATHIYLVDRPGTLQAQIRLGQLGIPRKHGMYFTTKMVTGYFGQGFASRLNKTIRVEKGLTYGIWGGYSASRFAGSFSISTFSKTASTAEAVRAVLEEIKRLKKQAPTSDELEKVRSSILGGFAGKRETPQALAGDLWLIEAEDLSTDHFEKMLSHVAATKAKDCLKLIRRTVEPSKMVIVVVGDANKLKQDLEEIAPVTVVSSRPQEKASQTRLQNLTPSGARKTKE